MSLGQASETPEALQPQIYEVFMQTLPEKTNIIFSYLAYIAVQPCLERYSDLLAW